MQCAYKTTILLVALTTLSSVFVQSSQVQAVEPTNRKGFSGAQLFEHHWQWTGPPSGTEAKWLDVRQRVALGFVGDRATVVSGDGLGPLHNGTSCADCHAAGGGAGVKHNVTLLTIDPRSEAISERRTGGRELLELFPGTLGPSGTLIFETVVHDNSTRDGYEDIRSKLAEYVPGGVEASWFDPKQRRIESIAKQPVVAGRFKSVDFYLSQRNSPALYGLGAIDGINPDRIVRLAKRQAQMSDGEITGRFVGKFGWRGQIQTLVQFVGGACAGELGLNQVRLSRSTARLRSGFAAQAADPADPTYVNTDVDINEQELAALIEFVASIPRPREQPNSKDTEGDVLAGEQLFNSVGCVRCHVADLHPISGMFSDLLLHDMGPELQAPSPAPIGNLADVPRSPAPRFAVASIGAGALYYSDSNPTFPAPYPMAKPVEPRFPRGDLPAVADRAEGLKESWDTLQREWRTPPLWGVADTGPYLHDGRAETLEEAIHWHGGEAASSRQRFAELSRRDRDLVVAFLMSLRAPQFD